MSYRRKQIAQILGIPALRIKFYTDQGLCTDIIVETGKGNERRYSDKHLFIFNLVKELALLGLPFSPIKKIVLDAINMNYFDNPRIMGINPLSSDIVKIVIDMPLLVKRLNDLCKSWRN